jgi:hypothetical protein
MALETTQSGCYVDVKRWKRSERKTYDEGLAKELWELSDELVKRALSS